MGLFGRNKKKTDDELLDLSSILRKGDWDNMTKFMNMCDYSKMQPDNSYHALLLSGQKRYLESKEMTRKEMCAALVTLDMFTRSALESPRMSVPQQIFLQTLKLTKEHIEKSLNVETFLADGKNVAIRDASTKKILDL